MIPANRQIHAKLEIIRPSGRVDVTPYLEAAEVELGSIEDLGTGTGADIGVRTLTFSLRNDGQMVRYWGTEDVLGDSEDILGDSGDVANLGAILGEGKLARNSFAPRDKASGWNLVGGKWEPLLWPYRGAVFQVAVTAPGETPTNWITLFEGYLGDNITTEPHRVTVRCRDKSKRLQDAYIDIPKVYEDEEGIPAETLIQSIINEYVDDPPTLYCPVPSGITFDEMKVEYVSVWDAIQNVANQMGWFLGYRWNGTSYSLTFIEPPRSKDVADFHFDWEDDFYQESLDIGDADIRNALTLSYRDKETGERVTLHYRDFPQLKNQESIDEYGKRAMQIEEADTSLIDTQEKALAFGEKCIWDLSELNATDRLDLPLFPWLDIFSTFTVTNPLISSTKDFYAVQSIRHTLQFSENGRFRTEVIATGRVVGAKTKWKRMETRPGSPGDPKKQGPPGPPGEDGYTPPIPADPVWGSYTLTSALHLTWHKAEHATDYEIREDLNWGNDQGMIFRGYSHSLSFVPRDRELILYLRALNVAGEYSEGYDTIHVSLPAPEPPQQPTVEAFFNALKIHPTPLNSPSVMGYYVYVTGAGIDDKLAIIAGGSLTYPLPSGTTVTIQVSAYDILGEGGKSEPLQATTTDLDEMDIPDWVKEPLENIEEQWVVETDAEGNIIGLVSVKDGEDKSHIAVLADRFSIATPQGRKQIFVFDAQDQKLYLVGDLIAEGLIRATEVQAEVAKALLMQAELGVFDEIHGLRIKADKITVGGGAPGLVTAKPSNSHLWHFDNSLQSTQGLSPVSGSATLVPDGGKFGGGVVVDDGLAYQTEVEEKYTVAVYKPTATWEDYANMTWSQLEAM